MQDGTVMRYRSATNICRVIRGGWQKPTVRETLVKGLGTVFCSQACQRPFEVKSAWRLTPEAQTKGERASGGDAGSRAGAVAAAECLLKQMNGNFPPTHFADKYQISCRRGFGVEVKLSPSTDSSRHGGELFL